MPGTHSRAIRADIPGATFVRRATPGRAGARPRERRLGDHWAGSHQEDGLGRPVDGEVVKETSLDGPLSLPDAL